MSQTPFPPGDPIPLVPPPAGAAPDGPSRAAARRPQGWREVAWVGFADEDDAAGVTPHGSPSGSSLAGARAGDPIAVAAGIDLPGSRPDGGALPRKRPRRPRGPRFTLRLSRGVQWVNAALRSLLRFVIAVATIAAIAVFAYHGGEWVAGLVGVPGAAVSVHPTTALAAPEREGDVAAAIADPAGSPAERAAYYLQQAKTGDPAAQFNLAVLYVSGSGVPQDYASAARWFRVAASAGNAAAQFDLAVMYEHGIGVAQNLDEAASWYRRAAQQDYPAAQYNLAIAHAEGHGAPHDDAAAARWYRAAAAHGLVPAMVNLAILYEKGDGVDQSPADAYAWYRAAARAGDGEAERRARELFQQFSGPGKARAVLAAAALTASTGAAAGPTERPAPVAKPPAAAPATERGAKPLAAQPPG